MSASKRKGTAAESQVVQALHEAGFVHAERRALRGAADCGDITGIPGVVLEVKACREQTLAKWIDEVEVERANAGAEFGVLWHKRRGRLRPESWYVTMTGETFVLLLQQWAGLLDVAPD